MSKIIIGIHGLGNKPPKNILKDWWEKSIIEGLNKYNFPIRDFDFELVYWADILNKEPLIPDETNRRSSLFLAEKYVPEQNSISNEPQGFRKKAVEYLEKYYEKILVNGVMSLNHPLLTDLFIHFNLRDLESYYSSSSIYYQGVKRLVRDVMIERLTDALNKHKNKKILLVAHSMGSIIAHDALIDHAADINVDTLVTIGSPLGQKYVLNKINLEQKSNSKNKLKVPDCIWKNWYNLSDLEDQVALTHTLSEIYESNSKGLKVIDKLVKNNYMISGDRNPHKSYGYLRTREFAEIFSEFITPEKHSIFTFLKKIFQ